MGLLPGTSLKSNFKMVHYEVCLTYSLAHSGINKSTNEHANVFVALLVNSQQGNRKYHEPRGGNFSISQVRWLRKRARWLISPIL